MARNEADRDDLYEEFRSAVLKWELSIQGLETVVVVGIRKDRRFSLYCGQDDCYHFDVSGRLLRAYRDGFLYRTQGTTLARLLRERTPAETVLRRHDLTIEELRQFCHQLLEKLRFIQLALQNQTYTIKRSVTDDSIQEVVIPLIHAIILNEIPLAPPFSTRKQ